MPRRPAAHEARWTHHSPCDLRRKPSTRASFKKYAWIVLPGPLQRVDLLEQAALQLLLAGLHHGLTCARRPLLRVLLLEDAAPTRPSASAAPPLASCRAVGDVLELVPSAARACRKWEGDESASVSARQRFIHLLVRQERRARLVARCQPRAVASGATAWTRRVREQDHSQNERGWQR